MANIISYLSKQYLDWCTGAAAATQPTDRWVGLSIGAPTSVSASEMGSQTNFSRVTALFGAAASPTQSASNTASLLFGPFSSPGAASGLVLFDGSPINSSNMLWYGTLQTARSFLAGDAIQVAPGALAITLTQPSWEGCSCWLCS
jgi:hypothetical protein